MRVGRQHLGRGTVLAPLAGLVLVASGCGAAPSDRADVGPASGRGQAAAPSATAPAPEASSGTTEDTSEQEVPHTDGRPRRALLSIPRIGIVDLPVLPYRGFTDDAAGTEIQDGGVAASPHGPRGGTGPGGIGNYQVTAHRLSSTQAFLDLPELRAGDVVHVDVGRTRLTYEVTRTRITSFREPASLRAQRAEVPGRPGLEATRAMVTLSTCRTQEDRAEGNYWSDQFGNPENRIDKIGVLRSVRRR